MTDENIFKFLRATKVEASEGFADRASAAVKSAAEREKSLDALCDGLLRGAKSAPRKASPAGRLAA